jgi:hypothetical protein
MQNQKKRISQTCFFSFTFRISLMTPECFKTFTKSWRSSKSYTGPTSDLNSLNEGRQHSEQKELPWSSGTDRKKLDSSFRLAFPMTLQSPAMHTDDTVRSGPARSYLTPGTKEAGNTHLHFRQSTTIWNEDLFYYRLSLNVSIQTAF